MQMWKENKSNSKGHSSTHRIMFKEMLFSLQRGNSEAEKPRTSRSINYSCLKFMLVSKN